MNSENTSSASGYRALYGKLFSALISQFGMSYANEVEDALQNAFYKSLKNWKPGQEPAKKESWLFIVARNDVLNQLKKSQRSFEMSPDSLLAAEEQTGGLEQEDLRLNTILLLSKARKVSSQVKVVFILKNIFGLHVKEIAESTLISSEAIYKSMKRAKNDFQEALRQHELEGQVASSSDDEIEMVEEILYAVFNIGYDSFSEKVQNIVNEDLCLEALALAKMLLGRFQKATTKNLMALFCFHLARIPAKMEAGKLIPFFEQDRSRWQQEFIQLGFSYLEKTRDLHKFHLEALIVSKHMTAEDEVSHWNEVIKLYQLLLSISNSPITKLNLCYCFSKAKRLDEARLLLEAVEEELPNEHIYLSLVKVNLFKEEKGFEAEELTTKVLQQIKQKIRREYILEYMTTDQKNK